MQMILAKLNELVDEYIRTGFSKIKWERTKGEFRDLFNECHEQNIFVFEYSEYETQQENKQGHNFQQLLGARNAGYENHFEQMSANEIIFTPLHIRFINDEVIHQMNEIFERV